ncbi:C2H2 type zinc-finger-domain-containing protein [Xylariomycetidae sp. FL0641]|nr:C2H2 type zinc-finger-domain-containing protein [Xylariomycetidae sp. FL0641]
MLEITTATTSAITASLPTSPMDQDTPLEANAIGTSLADSTDSIDMALPLFTPEQCLFCPRPSPTFADSVIHMQKSHGLFVPHQQHLVVNLEALFRYLHLVIFGYRECIQCGTERATVQAVQQHMTGKGHCKFDISGPDSEFAEFYDFSEPEDDAASDIGQDELDCQAKTTPSLSQKPVLVDEDSIRLPSGKIISRQQSVQAGPSTAHSRRRTRASASQLEYTTVEGGDSDGEEESTQGEPDTDTQGTRLLSRRERREKGAVTYQFAKLSANDRHGLMHLPAAQQRSLLATQYRHAVKVQKNERRRQGKVDRKGNKNLYAYWHTETPVYQCG